MPKKNKRYYRNKYRKGRRKEYKICNNLKDKGFKIAQRTAGSRSPIDIIAIKPKEKIIKLIQSKPDSWGKKRTNRLKNKHKDLNGKFNVKFIVK